MFKSIKEFIFGKPAPAEAAPAEVAPYKVPEPPATTPIPLVVESQLPVVQIEQVAAPVVETALVVETAPAKKPRKPRAPKAETPVAKPAAKKVSPVKKPRAPRAPKAK